MKAGPGSQYVQTFRDKAGNRFDGGKSYRLHVPANVPAAAFWSLTVYDTATRSMIQNPSNDSARSSYDKLKTNAEGSIDLYFGPKPPRTWKPTGSNRRRQRLLSHDAVLYPKGGFVRRHMEAAGHRVGEMTHAKTQAMKCKKAPKE